MDKEKKTRVINLQNDLNKLIRDFANKNKNYSEASSFGTFIAVVDAIAGSIASQLFKKEDAITFMNGANQDRLEATIYHFENEKQTEKQTVN